jgi:hypothetical protein
MSPQRGGRAGQVHPSAAGLQLQVQAQAERRSRQLSPMHRLREVRARWRASSRRSRSMHRAASTCHTDYQLLQGCSSCGVGLGGVLGLPKWSAPATGETRLGPGLRIDSGISLCIGLIAGVHASRPAAAIVALPLYGPNNDANKARRGGEEDEGLQSCAEDTATPPPPRRATRTGSPWPVLVPSLRGDGCFGTNTSKGAQKSSTQTQVQSHPHLVHSHPSVSSSSLPATTDSRRSSTSSSFAAPRLAHRTPQPR